MLRYIRPPAATKGFHSDFILLWCDIGGSMELLRGRSEGAVL